MARFALFSFLCFSQFFESWLAFHSAYSNACLAIYLSDTLAAGQKSALTVSLFNVL